MFLSRNGTKIRYEFHPALHASEHTETIVLIHGAGFDLSTWDQMIPLLQPRYRLLLFDLRGHGGSARGKESFGPNMFVEDLLALLAHLKIERFHTISHGAGAILSLYMARDYSDRMLTQTLISLPVFGSTDTVRKFAAYRSEFPRERSLLPLAEHLLSFVTLSPPQSPIWNDLCDSFLRVTESVYFECMQFFHDSHSEVMEMFDNCQIPTLLLAGEQDPLFPPYLSGMAASTNKNVRHRTIYEAANMVFVDRPQETFRQWQDFLRSISSAQHVSDPFLFNFHAEIRELIRSDKETLRRDNENSMPILKVTLSSRFEVALNGKSIAHGWNKRSAKELLIYLLLYSGVSRERLCEDLWPDHDPKKSRDRLRVYLSHLKNLLSVDGISILQTDSDNLRLVAVIEFDLLNLNERLDAACIEENPETQAAMLDGLLYGLQQDPLRDLIYDWSAGFRTKFEIKLIRLTSTVYNYLLAEEKQEEARSHLRILSMWYPDDLEFSNRSTTDSF